jgi:ribosomal subunit interface protein
MNVTFTARRFRPHGDLKEQAVAEVKKLGKFYDGIVSANVILSFERATNSVKKAEITLHVYGATLSAEEKSEDFGKSVDKAVAKLVLQLGKYKAKLRAKNKTKVRIIREKP